MSYSNFEMDILTIRRYVDQLCVEVYEGRPNVALLSSLARTTAHLAEAMMANQTLDPGD